MKAASQFNVQLMKSAEEGFVGFQMGKAAENEYVGWGGGGGG